MADLVTRILLDDKQFNDNIQKSKQQLKTYTDYTKNLGSTFSKLAGGIGVVVTASKAFGKAVNSNKAVQDKFISVTEGMQETVNDFFSALTSGDWTVFNDGILEAIKNGQKYVSTLRDVKASLRIGTYSADEAEAKRDKYESLMLQKGLSSSDRQNYYQEFKKASDEYIQTLERTTSFSFQKLQEALQTKGVKVNNVNELNEIYKKYLDPATQEYQQLEQYKKDKAELEKLGTQIRGNMGQYDTYYRTPEAKAAKKAFDENYGGKGYENIIRFQNLFNEENNDKISSLFENIVQLNSRVAEAIKTADDGKNDIKDLINEDNSNVIKIAQDNRKKQYEDNKVSWNVDNWVNEELYGLHDSLVRKARGLDPVIITYKLEPINKENPDELPLPTENKNKKNDNKVTLDDYATAISNIANVMTALNTVTNEGAEAWFNWASSLMQSSAIAITAIKKIITAKTAEAGANAAAEAAKTPIVGWLMVGAAIASVLGAFSALPKFQTGGIVGGNSFSGDNILARVNSGEMILNKEQQSNLFRMLNDGSTNTTSKEITFKIQGKELVGVLNNYNNRLNKVR